MRPVLVTGGNGFLGRAILSRLRHQGVETLGVGRSADNEVVCDLLDPDASFRLVAEHRGWSIIHCAAAVPRDREAYLSGDAAARSLQMTRNLARAAPERLVFTSSMTVYPDDVGVASEESASSRATGYAGGKLAAERALLDLPDALVVVLRLPGLFGPERRDGVLYNAALSFARGETPSLTDALPQWAAMHVFDAAEICVRAVSANLDSSIILNAGYPDRMSISDAVARLAIIFERAAPSESSPSFAFDLSRLESVLGPVTGDYATRLAELADWVRCDASWTGNA